MRPAGVDQIAGVIEGFVKLTAGLGVMGLVAVWQVDSLAEMVSLNPEQKKQLKRHKRGAGKSAAVLTLAGPMATVGGALMGIPIISCVNLIPF